MVVVERFQRGFHFGATDTDRGKVESQVVEGNIPTFGEDGYVVTVHSASVNTVVPESLDFIDSQAGKNTGYFQPVQIPLAMQAPLPPTPLRLTCGDLETQCHSRLVAQDKQLQQTDLDVPLVCRNSAPRAG